MGKIKETFPVASFFSGAGGLDCGFEQAGFDLILANEIDASAIETHRSNFSCKIITESIETISKSEFVGKRVAGFIGGPPCQSWSEAGSRRGINDHRGQLFFDYVNLIKEVKPQFFLAENVAGLLFEKNRPAFVSILRTLTSAGYNISFRLLNTSNYGVPQDRKRLIIVGYRTDLDIRFFTFPDGQQPSKTLGDALARCSLRPLKVASPGLKRTSKPFWWTEAHNLCLHDQSYSMIYLSRNRRRTRSQQSFTIQASARQAPLHPDSPKMVPTDDRDVFLLDSRRSRRLTVNECAAIQTFPKNFKWRYRTVNDGYKLVGNAVPVQFAKALADQIIEDLRNAKIPKKTPKLLAPGLVVDPRDSVLKKPESACGGLKLKDCYGVIAE